MGDVTLPGPLAALVLLFYASAALVLLGVIVLGMFAARDQTRLKYERELSRMRLDHDLERIARESAGRRD
jgi:hypothetical protein